MNMILSAISTDQMINAVVRLIIIGVIAGLLWWLIDYCKIPEPFNKVAKVIIAVVSVLIVIKFLLALA